MPVPAARTPAPAEGVIEGELVSTRRAEIDDAHALKRLLLQRRPASSDGADSSPRRAREAVAAYTSTGAVPPPELTPARKGLDVFV